jgi:hypothetical protein
VRDCDAALHATNFDIEPAVDARTDGVTAGEVHQEAKRRLEEAIERFRDADSLNLGKRPIMSLSFSGNS